MIVVDTNILAYLYLPTRETPLAERLLRQDPEWAAPVLWRSEFRSVLSLYLRRKVIDFDRAYALQREAEDLMAGREYTVDSYEVLRFVRESPCSAYDCEFVALAAELGCLLVTADRAVLRAFPALAVSLREAVGA
ncbi:type II toxin-antitoxin system VapC family toxin [Deferrisoma camini]|uniref:type II toxin-antitoxin system VapC family toxin n=1 Tax=Deferrisoma camini TaxID=1035120 RepID=UPI00046C9AD9|nr:type II toxin-antitoxin system VapC family toxin [Deferrisoma camini]